MKAENAFGTMSALVLALYCGSVLAAATEQEQMDRICDLVPNGNIIANVTNCHAYYICNNGTASAGQCSQTSYFNKDRQTCMALRAGSCDKKTVVKVNVCDGKQNGTFWATPGNCRDFTFCSPDGPQPNSCFGGYNFNPANHACVPESQYSCPENIVDLTDLKLCDYIQENLHFGNPTNCYAFSHCQEGVKKTETCSAGAVFDVEKGMCSYDSNYACPQLS